MDLVSAIERAVLKHRRKTLSKAIFARYKGTVEYGVFKGMHLNGAPNVSHAAYGLKIFGLYESDVVNQLVAWCPARTLVDIGAGDGYYPIGMLKAGFIEQAVCFEVTEMGRKEILRNAELNGVADRITVYGKADMTILDKLGTLGLVPEETLVLCDIEGGEFEVITPGLIQHLHGAKFIIELHDKLMAGDTAGLRSQLSAAFPESYVTRVVKDSARSWNGIPELEEMHDLDRAVVISEGRKIIGEWLVAELS